MNNFKIVDQTIAKPIVSVAILAYNHQDYIAQAIESVLMQKTKFSVQIVIAEDCSSDNTRSIILDYQKYPEVIKLILQHKMLGQGKITMICCQTLQANILQHWKVMIIGQILKN